MGFNVHRGAYIGRFNVHRGAYSVSLSSALRGLVEWNYRDKPKYYVSQ
jgi:hypothetical protein